MYVKLLMKFTVTVALPVCSCSNGCCPQIVVVPNVTTLVVTMAQTCLET